MNKDIKLVASDSSPLKEEEEEILLCKYCRIEIEVAPDHESKYTGLYVCPECRATKPMILISTKRSIP